ncbi:MAG: aspartate kinase [Ginsengibacter sp.]|jgi:aspartate kinase
MKVFKFGGASINSFERIKNLSWILQHHKEEKILIVISAMGKMTNTLEKIAEEYFEGKSDEALLLFESVKSQHLSLVKYLFTFEWKKATNDLEGLFAKTEDLLKTHPKKEYNFYYDQIVSVGELLSSSLISNYLREEKMPNSWVDVRKVIKTDSNYRDVKIDWELSELMILKEVEPIFNETNFVITQGFIGSDGENNCTTLGREGSDYTAAVFAKILKAESATIWKDVDGVMNGDPREFPDAIVLENLNYKEVIEMAYYGAQVIHPKTIKPLQNENIPLYVKSFINPQLPGTSITGEKTGKLPPIIVYKRDQALITLESIDFTFVEGEPINKLHRILDSLRLKPNLTQNTAISLLICVDDIPEKTAQIALDASDIFLVQIRKNLTLLTIRHHTPEIIEKLTKDKKIVLQQITTETIQLLISND